MKKNVAIALLLVAVLYLGASLIKVENQRYALAVGLCRDSKTGLTDNACLAKVETRTNPAWHLYYALRQ
jgi:hypothetical protein